MMEIQDFAVNAIKGSSDIKINDFRGETVAVGWQVNNEIELLYFYHEKVIILKNGDLEVELTPEILEAFDELFKCMNEVEMR